MMDEREALITLTADIVAAHVSHNQVPIADLPHMIRSVHDALAGLGAKGAPTAPLPQPAVPIRSSVKPDYIVCLEDGKKVKLLRGYLRKWFGMTPADYREKWGLPADYPMTAPNYTVQRRSLALQFGLGTNNRGGRKKTIDRRG